MADGTVVLAGGLVGARIISKGGDTDWVYYQTGTALLLPRLLAGRTRGPVFLAGRAPTRAVPTL